MSNPAPPAQNTITRKFLFRFTRTYRIAGLPFGVMPATCGVVLAEGDLKVRFGPWTVRTGLENVASVERSGPFGTLKTAGPAHLSLADRGLTFATNPDQGVCILFHQPVGGIEPTGRLKHPGLTVTVADCDRLIAALEEASS